MPRAHASTRQTRRFAEKRETILAAATELFNHKGVKGVSLAEVAQSVGLLTPSITYYFRKKEDLAAACLLQSIETFDSLFAKAAQPSSPSDRVEACVRLYFAFLMEITAGQRAAPMQFDDIRALTTPAASAVFTAYTQMFRRIRSLFDMPGGTSVQRKARNARAHLLLATLLWVPGWIRRYKLDDYCRVRERLSDIILCGLKGREADRSCVDQRARLPIAGSDAGRDAFLLAATKLINETGYRGASVEKISAQLNVTKGSFYHHNTNKDGLVVDCFERTFAVIRAAQNYAAHTGKSGWDRLCIASACLVDYQLSRHGPLLRTTALYAVPESIRLEMIGRINRLSDRLAELIVGGMRDGSIRKVDPVIAGELVISMINGAAELAAWAPGMTGAEAAEFYVKPLLEGAVAN